MLDRAYPSEYVYPQIFDRKTDVRATTMCDEMCASMNAKIIIPFRNSYSNVEDQFSFVDEEMLDKVHDKYVDFFGWTKCKALMLNVDDEDLKREINEIMTFLGECE